ncbi:putative reverse transcriptase domain-containing protein [Tanacetum coccineum]
MTTPITTFTSDSQMHNNIMAAGPYQPTTVTIPAVPATENSPAVLERTAVETILTISPENKAYYESEKEAIHLLLTGIRDEIYSNVDACKTAHEMWIAIERLQQGESLNIQDVKTNLFWEFGKFTSHDGESMDFFNNFNQNGQVNKIRAERIAKNANPLALVAVASPYPDPYYQASKSHKSSAPPSKQSSSTISNAPTKFKGKEIAKPITPLSESAYEEDSDLEQAQRDKDINKNVDTTPRYKNDNQIGQFGNQRTVTVAGARETVGSQVVQHTGIQCFNCKEFGHFAKECKKPKRVKDYTYHKEKMLLCKQAEKGVPLQAKKVYWLEDTDEEIDEQELEAHYVEKDDSNVTPDSPDMCDNDIQTYQNAEDERAALANLIANLKLDVDENKKIQKQLKKANTSIAYELKECTSILAETSRTLGESNSIWDSCLITLQNKQTKFERYKTLNNRTIDYDKLKHKLNETLGLLAQK